MERPTQMDAVIRALAEHRPAFHPEADFRHALAWQIQQRNPSSRVRHEVRTRMDDSGRQYLDIWLPDSRTAIELKYLTKLAVIEYEDEVYGLRDRTANDLGRYDLCRDIARLERIMESGMAKTGHAILLTNDPQYWYLPVKPDTNDAQFRLHEGRNITGTLAWAPDTGAGTLKGRENPLRIRGAYWAQWQGYSKPEGSGCTESRYLAAAVEPP